MGIGLLELIMNKHAPRNLAIVTLRTLLLLLPLMLATPSKAAAYADPGTGAFVYQAAYAAFLGGTFYLRKLLDRFWSRRK
ncbi:MAG TPA: hypothetical protein VK419_08325 [Bryobacteraceae bacterium]|nr:hypothetical protein [Bryobacteraceae bacterium]